MTKLTRFFGTCILVVSLSSITFAGDIMTPPVAPPLPADCTPNCSSAPQQPAPDSSDVSVIAVTAVDLLAVWLVTSIQ